MFSKPSSQLGRATIFKKSSLIVGAGLSLLLSACSVEQQEGEDPIAASADAQKPKPFSVSAADVLPRTTLGTRALPAKPMNVNLNDPVGRWDSTPYEREPDYPGYKIGDLQYITLKGDETDIGKKIKGKQLAVRVTRPTDENGDYITEPLPVILTQTGYSTNLISLLELPSGVLLTAKDPYLVQRGYVTVSVDVLGTGASEGGWELIDEAEQMAYLETLDWVLDQKEWCNGSVGVSGISYMGITALITAAKEQKRGTTDSVKAVFAMVPLGDAMRSTVNTGGILNGVFMSRWVSLTQLLTAQTLLPKLQFFDFAQLLDKVRDEHIAQIDEYFINLANDALNGVDDKIVYDGDFWKTRSPTELLDGYKVPTFIVGAHHDLFQRDAFLLYENIKDEAPAKLVIYKGDHITSNVVALAGRGGIPPAGNIILQWFDHYLKNIPEAASIESAPNVSQETLNHNGYVSSSDWPHLFITPERWYLHGDMGLNKNAPEGEHEGHEMSAAEPAFVDEIRKTNNGKYLHFDIEPNDGTKCSLSYVQWTLGLVTKPETDPCYKNNLELEKDALNYETARFTEDYYFNGPILAELWIKSSVTDAVLSVRVDIVTQGLTGTNVQPITNGLMLASRSKIDESKSRTIDVKMKDEVKTEIIQPWFSMGVDDVEMLVPGELRKVMVEIFPTSAVVKAGQKLRISIAPSNQAQGILNKNQKAATNGGVTTIVSNKDHPSSVLMPMVPRKYLN